MSEQDNVTTLQNGYKAFAAADLDGAFAAMADDIEWVVPGNSAISGTYRGKDEVGRLFIELAGKGFTTEPEEYFAKGDRVVVLTHASTEGHRALQADIWTFRDGKAVRFEVVHDTKLVEEIYGTK